MLKLCSFLQIMPLDLKIICSAKWEKQVQKTYHDRVTILFGVTSSSSIVFGFLCLKPTVSDYVCWFCYGLLLQVIGRRGWRHLAKLQIMEGTVTNTTWQLPVPTFRARLPVSLGGSLSVTNVAKILNKNCLRLGNAYRLCHSSAIFEISAKIMLVSSNYASATYIYG